ncbi:MAG: hypothetical protein HYS18_15540 [Burkholderiales bacterium]|nr:hypothetical protein [Burkholderiales bacterium]
MSHSLSCYFLDQALDDAEREFVAQALLGPWAKFRTGASSLKEKRVPLVLPAPGTGGGYQDSPELRAEQVRRNLRHAGIREDAGRQVVWIMPADSEWDAIFQFAIREETGFGPYVVQRWYRDQDRIVRGKIRVVDTQMLLRGLE